MEVKLPEWMQNITKDNFNLRTASGNQVSKYPVCKLFFKFTGKIVYCGSLTEAGMACESILIRADKNEVIVGFDMEWPFSYSRGSEKTALIQICPDESVCFLLHISRMSKIPAALIVMLTHKNVLLTGLNIVGDMKKLSRDFNIDLSRVISKNLVELKDFANSVLSVKELWSLAGLTVHLTGQVLDKPRDIRISQWNNLFLSQEQFNYAATDAFASLRCYELLFAKWFEESGFD